MIVLEKKMKKIFLLVVFIITSSPVFTQTMVIRLKTGVYTEILISDIDRIDFAPCGFVEHEGLRYHTTKIGDQCWLAENLNIGKRIDGSSDQTVADTDIEKYCYNNLETNCDTYGGLYQWDEAMQYNPSDAGPVGTTQGICPSGWHIPTSAEFQTLSAAVSNSGNALKAKGQGELPDGAGTNTSGFSALLAGYSNGIFIGLGYNTYFWSSTEYDGENAYYLYLNYTSDQVSLFNEHKDQGFSVRCLKD